ncbi:hypothetical protein RIF29_42158 [Crotalaria pallida]|uniref:Secreted protein n=1 Tax=Crotalaria pallida TaxID=3830 RepID=A0AAN9HTD6_CROPI
MLLCALCYYSCFAYSLLLCSGFSEGAFPMRKRLGCRCSGLDHGISTLDIVNILTAAAKLNMLVSMCSDHINCLDVPH